MVDERLKEVLEWYRVRGYLAVDPPHRSDVQVIVDAARQSMARDELAPASPQTTGGQGYVDAGDTTKPYLSRREGTDGQNASQ